MVGNSSKISNTVKTKKFLDSTSITMIRNVGSTLASLAKWFVYKNCYLHKKNKSKDVIILSLIQYEKCPEKFKVTANGKLGVMNRKTGNAWVG